MKIKVTYTSVSTKEIEVDNKFKALINDETWTPELSEELITTAFDFVPGRVIAIEDSITENVLAEW